MIHFVGSEWNTISQVNRHDHLIPYPALKAMLDIVVSDVSFCMETLDEDNHLQHKSDLQTIEVYNVYQ